ncbi:MAG TPA: indolepyruvate ferredoxin oxidoreductase family protein [Baekduia sp.]|uniref:indolepyruvate ferredoxin oxidoreductase family protein n=1 Tax=Baekduia sp. TaxID=2600305 RepID=UPI002D7979BD|nr:indolepyruvate ferredoxin oxidoreductase family protein [Baekduia sp.]HET6505328.1 indolepyruvate ferredoxin oxidoreductase family protein [Baekduia sp.]
MTGTLRDVSLADRWDPQADMAYMSGVQAIVRALMDVRRADAAAGVRGGGFVSGYQGSPLGGLDLELGRQEEALTALGVRFAPGLNEELAATAVWGSQMASALEAAAVDGVLGTWFGKNPGLDRAADAIRHATIAGVGAHGGAVAVVGDDPDCKSSTLPSAAERTLSGLLVPVLAPSSVQDVLRLGRHAYRLSRSAGLWSALKVAADVADATATAALADEGPVAVERLVEWRPTAHLLGAASIEPERHLLEVRLPAALAYARAAGLNPIVSSGPRDRLGIVAGGTSYAAVRRALDDLGLGPDDLAALGVRILKLDLLWPLDGERVRELAAGLRDVLVVEDKLPFVEPEVRAALYDLPERPRVLGKRDADGRPLLPVRATAGADAIGRALAVVLGDALTSRPAVAARLDGPRPAIAPLPIARTPAFCSGCPHSRSTRAEPGVLVGAGIGCHVMVVNEPERHGDVVGVTQMGGEGAQWIGMAPFVTRDHFVQNLGDGTFHHSGSLAIRAAVAAGVNITYKLLYNDAVAMTGGQSVQGVMPVPELTRALAAEGVARIAITTDDPARYRDVDLAPIARVHDRDELAAVERALAAVSGVTVLVHDQMCATERRRLRRRGTLPAATARPWINERVCEGCGDCGDASGCLSVEPVATELGRKTRIHQAGCNSDLSCLKGDCPSFLTVVPASRPARPALVPPPTGLPEPPPRDAGEIVVRMVGIGGTGVVTVAQILAMAAHLQGLAASGLDQTGMSQKAGPVVSDVRLGPDPERLQAPRAGAGAADVLLAFDLLAATEPRALAAAARDRTTVVASDTLVPTGAMVVRTDVEHPGSDALLDRLRGHVREVGAVLDAQRLAEVALGDHLPANMILLGAAWQLGLLPVGWEALSRAVELNGTAVASNLAALGWGRAAVVRPDAVADLLRGAEPVAAEPAPAVVERVAAAGLPAEIMASVARRADDLVGFGGRRAMERYLTALAPIAALERERTPGRTEITASAARQLHRLMAYKDEYEVARLHLLPEERARRERELGAGTTYRFHLHPPLLRALGLRRKLTIPSTVAIPAFHALRRLRRLRGTPLDPFGHAKVRRVERALPGEYLDVLEQALAGLSDETHAAVVALSEQAEAIRGYEDIKLANVERWRAAVARASASPAGPELPIASVR